MPLHERKKVSMLLRHKMAKDIGNFNQSLAFKLRLFPHIHYGVYEKGVAICISGCCL